MLYSPYDRGFFAHQALAVGPAGGLDQVASSLVSLLAPQSVVDVGCGVGVFISAMRNLGVGSVLGVDGPWVPPDLRRLPADCFLEHDLTRPLVLDRRFDLVVSLEVAEHLDARHALDFVRSLVALGPVVVLSAAIPLQDGTHHVNEQWPAYWAGHFRSHGYVPIDCLRAGWLMNPAIARCYSQNAIVYLDPVARPDLFRRLTDHAAAADPLPVVHPDAYFGLVDAARNGLQRQGFFKVARQLPALVLQGIRRRLFKDAAPTPRPKVEFRA